MYGVLTYMFLLASEVEKHIADMNVQNIMRIVNSFRPLLLEYGYFAETVDT